MNEGYAALYIAIVCKVNPDEAFSLLSGERPRKTHKWTLDELQEIKALREKGVIWSEIGSIYGVCWKTAARRYSHYKKIGRI